MTASADTPALNIPRPTTVVNKYHKVESDLYIGRGSLWGNPWPIDDAAGRPRETVVSWYETYLLQSPHLLAQLPSIQGKRLECFCAPALCHGDVLAHYADHISATGLIPERLTPVIDH